MSYQALYRKYRPMNFDDVVGQEIIVRTLKNSLKITKTSHAYMFSGPRGTGKTTIAKILAKAVNCLNLENGISCDKCSNCKSILSNETTDIIEIDAASNNGVDEIREIRNKINLVPSELKYKVYIIDEVHMLSVGAFNALLKTLEEPPNHVIFILATTDPHKVPVTIISRCQCFDFKRIIDESIVSRLQNICNKENISIQLEVLNKIAKISDGGMRDALGLLDKISSYCTDEITMDDFNKINGLVSSELLYDFVKFVYEKNIVNILEMINDIHASGKDFVIFAQDLIDLLRDYMIKYYVNKEKVYPINFILSFIDYLNRLLVNLKNVANLKILFESSILSFMGLNNYEKSEIVKQTFDKKDAVSSERDLILETVAVKKEPVENISAVEEKKSNVQESFSDSFRFVIVNNTFSTAKKEYLLALKENWIKLNDYVLDKSYGAASCYLIDSQLRAVGENEIIITCNYESVLERGLHLLENIEKLLEKVFSKKYKVAILTDEEWELERQRFIEAKNNGIKYEYKEIKNENFDKKNTISLNDSLNKENDSVQRAISLFGEDIVKIK